MYIWSCINSVTMVSVFSEDWQDLGMTPNIVTVCVIIIGCIIIRALHLASQPSEPELYFRPSDFVEKILDLCPLLKNVYMPPLIWGRSGHLQTIVYGKLGRIQSPFPRGQRHKIIMRDGATLTFDIFEPLKKHVTKGDYTMLVCPGIANSSESVYIRTFVDYAQNAGYRVGVLNHLGAIQTIKLTSPRIFTYGGTDEYAAMVEEVHRLYPDSKFIAVGFSMGGNLAVKYLGEKSSNQKNFLCGLSICQGYDVERCQPYMLSWEHLRRGYIFAMTLHQKKMLRTHADILFGSDSERLHGKFDTDRILAATSLVELDDLYSRKRAGFSSIEEYYRWCSCRSVMDKIKIPMFFLNSADDPLVPPALHDMPHDFVTSHENCIFAVTKHGGHLGFFTGSGFTPEPVTWLDKVIVQYADALIQVSNQCQDKRN
ncbi:monoacylglycerol lipase ABHD2 isoform X1 [Lingula anatina]|uniref:Monoacylglycerol lipase ABHD2 isoform X1 n=2 Tax=Lingula anatina TaxID=7574 RepID=A0A1S3IDL4_LINAN|nr:monoacylglycerol lipase ABHD2 isoform X1 [Lingula anatina]|eukprot:XP_013395951.1 monoacylglycerol lipase ABHD2 isoform X1 [Lingula anatina]